MKTVTAVILVLFLVSLGAPRAFASSGPSASGIYRFASQGTT